MARRPAKACEDARWSLVNGGKGGRLSRWHPGPQRQECTHLKVQRLVKTSRADARLEEGGNLNQGLHGLHLGVQRPRALLGLCQLVAESSKGVCEQRESDKAPCAASARGEGTERCAHLARRGPRQANPGMLLDAPRWTQWRGPWPRRPRASPRPHLRRPRRPRSCVSPPPAGCAGPSERSKVADRCLSTRPSDGAEWCTRSRESRLRRTWIWDLRRAASALKSSGSLWMRSRPSASSSPCSSIGRDVRSTGQRAKQRGARQPKRPRRTARA